MAEAQAAGYGIQAVGQAYGAYQEGRAQKYKLRAQKYIAEVNARLAEMRAEDAIKRGQEAESGSRANIKKFIGKQRATAAAFGISADVGSAQEIQQETRDIGELEALNIKINAAREAFGYRTEGAGYRMQAEQYGFESKMKERAAKQKMADTLLSGSMQSYSAYKGY